MLTDSLVNRNLPRDTRTLLAESIKSLVTVKRSICRHDHAIVADVELHVREAPLEAIKSRSFLPGVNPLPINDKDVPQGVPPYDRHRHAARPLLGVGHGDVS